MKNPWKSRHPLFRAHRVYAIQNDRLNLTINKFSMIFKMLHSSKRYSQKCWTKNSKELEISQAGALFSKPLKTRYSCDQDGRFEYHNPYELQKVGDDFFMDFSFFAHRFL